MSRLSDSKFPAYHLRPNKAIDRLIFLEILNIIESYVSLNNHKYIGFGGPFLEDFRLLSNEFPNLEMFSVEMDEQVFKRQSRHKCSGKITTNHCTFEEYLSTQFPTDCPTITWADYTDFSREYLLEISDIGRKSIPLSVVRVTVRAETPVYKELGIKYPRRPVELPSYLKKKFEYFVKEYLRKYSIDGVAYDNEIFKWNMFREENYPDLLAKIITSIISAACTRPKCFLPLHSVKYSDGTIMLSLTGVICQENDYEEIKKHFNSKFEFMTPGGTTAESIDVPLLSTKERLHLESIIPVQIKNGHETTVHLTYLIEGDESENLSEYKMSQYERYHRLYPYFGKLIP